MLTDTLNSFPGLDFLKGAALQEVLVMFPSALSQQGLSEFKAGQYDLLGSGYENDIFRLRFEIRDVNLFHVGIDIDSDKSQIKCSCNRFSSGQVCDHVVTATLILWASVNKKYHQANKGLQTREMLEKITALFDQSEETEASVAKPTELALEAVYYCYNRATDLFGMPQRNSPSFTKKIARSRPDVKPKSKDYHSELGVSRSEIPGSLLKDQNFYFMGVFDLLSIKECIQYQFTDGLILTAYEIFNHPYCKLLPKALLPLIREVQSESSDALYSHVMLFPLPYNGEISAERAQLEKVFLNVLLNTLEEKVPLYLVNTTDKTLNRTASLVTEISKNLPSDFVWKIEPNLENDPDKEEQTLAYLSFHFRQAPKIMWTGWFSLDQKTGSLKFHNFSKSFEEVKKCFPPLYYLIGSNVNEQLPISDEEELILLSQVLEKNALDKNITFENGFKTESLSVENLAPQVFIKSDGTYNFCLVHPEKKYKVWNLPKATIPLFKLFSLGMGGIVYGGGKQVAKKQRGFTRDRDLFLMRHSGAGVLLFLEAASLIIDKADGKKNTKADLLSQTKQMLIQFNAILEQKEGHPLSENSAFSLYSRNVETFVKRFLTEFVETASFEENIFSQKRRLILEDPSCFHIHFLKFLLSRLIEMDQAEVLLKSKSKLIRRLTEVSSSGQSIEYVNQEKIEAPDNYLLPFDELNKNMDLFLPLSQIGVEVFLNGERVETMDESELITDFHINEDVSSSSQQMNWFELHPRVFFKGEEIPLSECQNLTEKGIIHFQGKTYILKDRKLPTLDYLAKFWGRISQKSTKGSRAEANSKYLKLPRHEILEMLVLRKGGVKVTGGPEWEKICTFYDTLDQKREPLVTKGSEVLKPFQFEGVQWLLDLYRLRLGGILGDDMGLGKTIQTLFFLLYLHERSELGKVLIVVPTSLTYNWVSEALKFTPDLPVQAFKPQEKKEGQFDGTSPAIWVTTYGLLNEHSELFKNTHWNIVVFDEAQNLKNISTQRTGFSRSLKAQFKLCLTGTPLENHLGEFYSLVDLVVPGALGDLPHFRKMFTTGNVTKSNLDYLKSKTKPLVLRRHKSNILKELPAKTESVVKLPFSQKQKEIYRNIAISWNDKVKESLNLNGESKSQLVMLTALLRLRQACSNPESIPNVKFTEEPPKVALLKNMLEPILESKENVLIFTQFLGTLGRIEKELTLANVPFFTIQGSTSRLSREKILEAFNMSEGGAVLLMTLKTGGVGLNLTKASYVFHIEPWWNPAVENQATDRAHRMGQEKKVQVYRFIMEESVEEKIEILKKKKEDRFNSMFGFQEEDGEAISGKFLLSSTDFTELIS